MQMFRSVFQQSISAVVVLHGVHSNGLKTSPTDGHDERITSFKYTLVPSMFFKTKLKKMEKRLEYSVAKMPVQPSPHCRKTGRRLYIVMNRSLSDGCAQ